MADKPIEEHSNEELLAIVVQRVAKIPDEHDGIKLGPHKHGFAMLADQIGNQIKLLEKLAK
ncbi:MAG: hypothetical protein ACU0AU_04830 [Cognatishimia activa]